MIELSQVAVGFGKQRVLQDVSAVFPEGCLTSVLGVNGCGKSTLLKTVLGMVPLEKGAVRIDGQSLEGLSRNALARKLAYLSQGRNTPDMTVEQLVLHGRFPHLSYPRRYTHRDREIAREAMERLGIGELASKPLPTLSGGMRQNAYIAMALTQETDYILLDEPTTYLDIPHQLSLMGTLRTLADGGKGIVAVTHDLQMAFTFSDRILLLKDGAVAAAGTPEELCRHDLVEQTLGVSLEPSGNGYVCRYPG